jgi:hypothetical protein
MDWLTFGASLAATLGTLIVGALGIRYQMRQEKHRQLQAEQEMRQADRDYYTGHEREMWQRARAEFDRLRQELVDERRTRQEENAHANGVIGQLQRELIEERAARLRDTAAAEDRINNLVVQIRALREENELLRRLLAEHGITVED